MINVIPWAFHCTLIWRRRVFFSQSFFVLKNIFSIFMPKKKTKKQIKQKQNPVLSVDTTGIQLDD